MKNFTLYLFIFLIGIFRSDPLLAQGQKEVLDSVVSVSFFTPQLQYRQIFNRNPQGMVDRHWFYKRTDSSLAWDPSVRDVFTYDTQGRVTEQRRFEYLFGNPAPKSSLLYQYDSAGVGEINVYRNYDVVSGQFVNDIRFHRFQNAKGLDTLELRYDYNILGRYWDTSSIVKRNQYLPSGKLLHYAQEDGVTRGIQHQYNGQNQLRSSTAYFDDGSTIDSSQKLVFRYDVQGRLDSYTLFEKWPGAQWDSTTFFDVRYRNSLNRLLIELWEFRDDGSGNFKYVAMQQCEHDPGYTYDDLVTQDYSSDSLAMRRIHPNLIYVGFYGKHKLLKYRFFTGGTEASPNLTNEETYYYSRRHVGLPEREGLSTLKLYPNPSMGVVHLELPQEEQEVEVRIISIDGRAMGAKTFQNQKELEVELPKIKGLYLIEVHTPRGLLGRNKVVRE